MILCTHVAGRGKKLKNSKDEMGAAISDSDGEKAQGRLNLAELEFVRLHVHPPPPEAYAFGLQAKPLLDGRVPAQFDLAAGTEHSVPGQPKRSPKYPCDLPRKSRQAGRARHRAVS